MAPLIDPMVTAKALVQAIERGEKCSDEVEKVLHDVNDCCTSPADRRHGPDRRSGVDRRHSMK